MIAGPVLVDAGPLVAIIRSSEQHHAACRAALRDIQPPLVTCWPVLTEAAYLLRDRPDEVLALLRSIRGGFLELAPLDAHDLPSIAGVLEKYGDLKLQLADACLVHLANREGIDTIFTLDRRDFSTVRKATGTAMTIVPGDA